MGLACFRHRGLSISTSVVRTPIVHPLPNSIMAAIPLEIVEHDEAGVVTSSYIESGSSKRISQHTRVDIVVRLLHIPSVLVVGLLISQ